MKSQARRSVALLLGLFALVVLAAPPSETQGSSKTTGRAAAALTVVA